MNYGIETLYQALNNNLTFQDNFSSTVATVSVSVDSNGNPTSPVSFKLTNNQNTVKGVIVINTVNLDNPTSYPPGAVGVSFSFTTQSVILNNIKGLNPGTNYNITLLAI